jgi:ankyrin repeat protein
VDGRQVGAVRILLAAGANAAARDRNGYSPLRLVTNQFYEPEEPLLQQIAVSLLQSSSGIDAEDAGRLLNRCAQEGWADVASLVVQRGFNVKGDVGDKTLQDAAKSGYPNVMRVLLEAGAGPDANDPNTQTPLQLALGTVDSARIDPNTRLEMVELLVSKGAKVNLKLNPYLSSQQPIGIAVTYLPGENLKIVEFLLAHGAVVTPDLIDLARLKNRPDVVALLLKAQRPAAPAKK